MRKLRKKIKKVQDARRFEHTLGVEFTAAALAMRNDASIADARTAGLLHDCAKCLSDQKRIAICEKYRIPMTEVEKRNPFLLHAKAGACLAREKYGVEDPDILNAIRYHTTGRENMSLLEKIIFVADYIEPGRKQGSPEGLQKIRQLAFQDLDAALLKILDDTLRYLKSGNGEIDPATEATWRYYREIAGQTEP
ncbi:MAG: bis(5'-nucleosyl)-tetraphosphatase (symmetrical) YqeK [Roseburia sp.]|nr:bis(5'-nucleosyl)-tetraphosphatase (symmetrical) YqeK [Roseburia sp.]MCM1098093.1 bis(5'-nucleosyl)-tetraphosphatase (symmetrical) YqeK [Ruminococcus flavefaciens]